MIRNPPALQAEPEFLVINVPLTVVLALVLAFIAYAATEYAQTKRLESITRQFDTRTIVLIPIAIAINIILGATFDEGLEGIIRVSVVATGIEQERVQEQVAPPTAGMAELTRRLKSVAQPGTAPAASHHPLSVWSEADRKWVIPNGRFTLWIGRSSAELCDTVGDASDCLQDRSRRADWDRIQGPGPDRGSFEAECQGP